MPTLWKSSERPMYVRTVWIDGFRHAILTRDDPFLLKLQSKKKRPRSSASYAGTTGRDPKQLTLSQFRKTRLSQNEDQLEECIRKLNFVITSEKPPFKQRIRPKSEHVEKLNLTELESESEEEEFVLKANAQRLNEFETSRSKVNNLNVDMKTVKSNRTARTENKENNELSERVLQWLDLAGKFDMLISEEAARMSQPRHSWPEIQKRSLTKSKTVTDLKTARAKAIDSSKFGDGAKDKFQAESGVIDRHDFYVTTQTNTIENYARQSRNARGTPRNNTAASNLKGSPEKTTTTESDIKINMEQTRQKVANEIHAVEKQYADLINKKIIPNYNKHISKRQVHIFVPTVPKKTNISNTASRTESLL